jgi:hypothetical protein
MSEPLLPRWTARWTSAIFSDESSHSGEQFFVFGGLYIRLPSHSYKDHIQGLENKLAGIKKRYNIGIAKWEKVPEPGWRLEGYKALVEYLASPRVRKYVKFRSMVVDTHEYPLKKKSVGATDKLVGYLMYYCVFLTDSIMLKQHGFFYDITIDDFEWRPETGHDSIGLQRCVEHRYLNKCREPRNRSYRHSQLAVADDKNSNILQMADVLTGAVAFCHNGGMVRDTKRSVGMKELVAVIRKNYGGLPMNRPQSRGPFGIWWFRTFKEDGKRPYPLFPKEGYLTE